MKGKQAERVAGVLLDIHVILDVLLARPPYVEAAVRILALAEPQLRPRQASKKGDRFIFPWSTLLSALNPPSDNLLHLINKSLGPGQLTPLQRP